MSPSFRLGRIAGVELTANWSWLLVVALIVWSLASGVFPYSNPGLSDGAYVAMALAATPMFFASLVAHELGHALQARRDRMQIEGITLWVFGGVARFRGMFPSAGAELRIALAGPAVSLALGVVFLASAVAVPLPSAIDGVVYWLGQINLTLLAFNLLPALPLDGGRVLRALLWARRDDLQSATRTAAAFGRAFGQVMIAGGLLLLILGGLFIGAWLAFIGWFLLLAAEAEARMIAARAALHGLRVRDVMISDPISVSPALPLDRFVDDVFVPNRYTAYPVAEPGRPPIGLISFRQVLTRPRRTWSHERVADRMSPLDATTVLEADTPLEDAFAELAAANIGRALVRDDGHGYGLLSMTDVARVLEAQRRTEG